MPLTFRASFDDSAVSRAYRNMSSGAETTATKVSASFATLTSTALFAGVFSAGAAVGRFAGDIADSAEAAQLGTQSYQELTGVFEQGGTEAAKFGKAMGSLTTSIQEALDGNLKTITSFERLGITWAELNTLTPEEILSQVSDGLKNSTNATESYAAATDVLGKGQQKLIGTLMQGSDAIEAQRKQITTMSDEGIKALDELGDAWTRMGRSAMSGVGNAVAYFSKGFEAIFDDIAGNDRAMASFRQIQNDILNPPAAEKAKAIPEDPRVTKAREEGDKMAAQSLAEYYKLEHEARTRNDKMAADSLEEYYRLEHDAALKRLSELQRSYSQAQSNLSQSRESQLAWEMSTPDARREAIRDQRRGRHAEARLARVEESKRLRGGRDSRPGATAQAQQVELSEKALDGLARKIAETQALLIPK